MHEDTAGNIEVVKAVDNTIILIYFKDQNQLKKSIKKNETTKLY